MEFTTVLYFLRCKKKEKKTTDSSNRPSNPLPIRFSDALLLHSHCLLSDHLATPDCIVLRVEGWDDTVFWYCHPEDDQWTKHEYNIGSHVLPYPDKEDEIEKDVICSIAACPGTFYFDCGAKDLRTIDFTGGGGGGAEPVLTPAMTIDDDTVDKRLPCLIFLVESGGELYMVRLFFTSPSGDEIDGVGVYKMDFSGRRWRAVRDLGGRAFLLSPFYFGASCCAGDGYGVLPDCVYFVIHWSKTLQVFDVREETYKLHKLDEAPEAARTKHSGCFLPTSKA